MPTSPDAAKVNDWTERSRFIEVAPEEFVSARELSRDLGKIMARLESGELQKAVVMNRGKPRAILRSWKNDRDDARDS